MKCSNPNCVYDQCNGHQHVEPMKQNSEHQTVQSKLTGKHIEIGFGPLPANADPSHGGLIPQNPFASSSQQRYMYAHPDILGQKGLKEWSTHTDFKNLPKKVKK